MSVERQRFIIGAASFRHAEPMRPPAYDYEILAKLIAFDARTAPCAAGAHSAAFGCEHFGLFLLPFGLPPKAPLRILASRAASVFRRNALPPMRPPRFPMVDK